MKIKDIKEKNISKILNCLRKNENISKKDLSQLIHLSPSTLTEICTILLEKNMIVETGTLNTDKPGRKKVLLTINYDYRKVIGIDIKKNFVSFVCTNLKGEKLHEESMKMDTAEPYDFIKNLLSKLDKFMTGNRIMKKETLGIGVSIVGAVDFQEKSTLDFIGFWNEIVPLGKILEEKTGLPVCLNNNVKNLAIQQMFLDEKLEDFFLLKYGTGVGGSLVIKKELFKRDSSLSGEIGHSIVTNDEAICPICRRKGCFEKNFSEVAVEQKIRKIFSKVETPVLYAMTGGDERLISFEMLLKAGEAGEIRVLTLLEEIAEHLAVLLLNMFTLFYPQKIVLCGKIFKNDLFVNYLFSFIHKKQILDFKKIIEVSAISSEDERSAPIYSVLKEKFYLF